VDARAGLAVVTAGVLAGQVGAAVRPGCTAALVALAAAATLVAWLVRRSCPSLAMVAVALIGLAAGALRMRDVVAPVLPANHVARLPLPLRTTLLGEVVAAPRRQEHATILIVACARVGRGPSRRRVHGRVRLAIRGHDPRWRYGDRLVADVTLRRPRNFANPGGYDWVGQLARGGIHVIASAWEPAAVRRLGAREGGLRTRLERWRVRLAARIAASVPAPEGAVLQALVVGEEGGIDPPLRDAFTRAGVVHVLSISGLHVTLVAGIAWAAARGLLARSEWLLLRGNVGLLAALASLVPVALYAALAGLGIATLRAAVMIAAVVAAAGLGRRADVVRTVTLAALLLALTVPGAPLDIGFQLSFASVVAIVAGTRRLLGPAPRTRSWRRRIMTAGLVSPCAVVGTAPLTAWHFHQVSLAAVVANPLTVPIFGSVVVALGLVGALLEPVSTRAATAAFVLAGFALRPGIALVRACAAPAWAAIDVPVPTPLELGLVYTLLAALVLAPRRGAALLATLALVALLADTAWWLHERFGRTALRVTFLDVGQGDAAVAELPGGRVVVIDAGGFPGSTFDTGAAIVGPFLWRRKIMRVDVLAMTHAHPDHSGGLTHLLAHHHPREFWWTGVPGDGPSWERLRAALAASGTRVRVLAADARLDDGLAVLHPPPGGGWRSLNDSSLTLALGPPAARVLLTGDIERRAEDALLQAPGGLGAAVLKVPHHGSRTSSTLAFVDAVAPRVAVVSVGADNRYRLPAAEVERRYRARGACVLRTDRCGAVIVTLDGPRLDVQTTRPGCECAAATPPG
jgi:competence protein ComEC